MTHGPMRDSKSDLLEAAQAAVKDSEEKAVELAAASRRSPRRRRTVIGALGVIAMVGIVLLILQPAWLAGPTAVPPDPPSVAAAGLRVLMLKQRRLVFDYAKSHGRLPASLVETGDTIPGVHYTRLSDSLFKLTGHAGDSVIVLLSGDAQAAFLGNSLRILKNRGGT